MTGKANLPGGGAAHRLSFAQKVSAALLLLLGAFVLRQEPAAFLRALVIVHIAYAALFVGARLIALIATIKTEAPRPRPAPIGHLPSVSLLCPLYREPESVGNLIGALARLSYPSDRVEVLLLLEADDDETSAAIGRLPDGFRVVRVPAGGPRTKPNALNHGLAASSGDLVGVYDAEDRPEADQLRKVAERFISGPEDLACVQAQLNYYNRDDGFIPRMFALEYALHFDWFLPGLSRCGLPLPLGGTSNFVRRDALLSVGGWDAHNVTEDADLGLRLARAGYRLEAIDSTTFEEATDTPARWVRQRSRWIKGFIQTGLVHMRRPMGWRTALTLHAAILAVVVSALLNPLSWGLLLAHLMGWPVPGEGVFSGGLGLACLVLFVGGNLLHVWLFMVAPLTRGWYALTAAALLLPFYWLLQSVAGYKALAGFLLRPHHWEKTDHSAGEDSLREAAA